MIFSDFKFFSEALGMQVTCYVLLPQRGTVGQIGVDSKVNEGKFKCVYLLHGCSDDHSIWMRRTSVERYVEAYGVAVVMPFAARSFYMDNDGSYNYYTYIHSRDFYKKGHNLDKIVICGHIPSVIYNKEEFNDDPKYFKDKKIVMIDGGESIQLGAQINVLEINNEEIVGFKRYQDFEYVDIIKDQVSYTNYKGACWPFLQIELLEEKGRYFTLCKILGTLEVCYIKNEYITFDKEGFRVKDDCPSNFLNVKINDKVMLIKKLDGYSLCKIDGSLGFINNECIKWS